MKSVFTESVSPSVLKQLSEKNWYRHGIYRDNILSSSMQVEASGPDAFHGSGIARGLMNMVRIGDPAFLEETEFTEIANAYKEKLEKEGINYVRKYTKGHGEAYDSFLAASEQFANRPYSQTDNGELASEFEHVVALMRPTWPWLWSLEFFQPSFETFLRQQLVSSGEVAEHDLDKFLQRASITKEMLPFQKERDEILSLDLGDEKGLNRLYDKYSWMRINVLDGRPYSKEEYVQRARMISADPQAAAQAKDLQESMQEATNTIMNIKKGDIRELLELTRELVYQKTYRIDTYSQMRAYTIGLFEEIARRLHCTDDNLFQLTSREIPEALRANYRFTDFNKRKTYAMFLVDGDVHFVYGTGHQPVHDIMYRDNFSSIRELKGTIAYKGVVRAPVKVLMTDKDLPKLQKGDILVANLTNPDYDPAFGIVSGVVTDEGGILCHSAIMAREFKIPCVIGTKIATRVLKDGDIVELDADRGVVTILSRA